MTLTSHHFQREANQHSVSQVTERMERYKSGNCNKRKRNWSSKFALFSSSYKNTKLKSKRRMQLLRLGRENFGN